MKQNQSATSRTANRKPGTPGAFSRWMQRTMNTRQLRKIRGGNGSFMGMHVLILNTVGRRSGQPRETPLAWFGDGEESWLLIGSGGGTSNPDWHANLMAHPEQTTIELPGRDPLPVRPQQLEGAAREEAFGRIVAVAPRIGKYQAKSARQYPVVRLTPR